MSALRPGEITLDPVRAQLRLLTRGLPRVEACGHAGGKPESHSIDSRPGMTAMISIIKCRDCGHTWKEVSP